VLIVGHGNSIKGGPYFIVKNSFGTSWGSGGYARISTSIKNDEFGVCGIYSKLI
jgi:C1A family cysteine protease